jgi:hypothetical protein
MKYFAKEAIRADNDSSLTPSQQKANHRKFNRNCKAYNKQLLKLESRISKQAFNFFYLGFTRWGLHDARLVSFSAGDGLDYRANGKQPFRINRQKAGVRIEILNYEQNLFYTFHFTGIRKTVFDFPSDDPLCNSDRVDGLFTYELTAAGKRFLRLEFLFTSGAIILIEFAKLQFARKRVRRRYAIGEMYS